MQLDQLPPVDPREIVRSESIIGVAFLWMSLQVRTPDGNTKPFNMSITRLPLSTKRILFSCGESAIRRNTPPIDDYHCNLDTVCTVGKETES